MIIGHVISGIMILIKVVISIIFDVVYNLTRWLELKIECIIGVFMFL